MPSKPPCAGDCVNHVDKELEERCLEHALTTLLL
jgi:hypothetical protein